MTAQHLTRSWPLTVVLCLLVTACDSSTEPATPQVEPPATPLIFYPTILVAEPRRGLRLTIRHMGGEADGFTIQRGDGSGSFATISTVMLSRITADSDYIYDDWNLQVLQYYEYRVSAFKGSQQSHWSEVYGGTAAGDQFTTLAAVEASADAYVDQGLATSNFGTQNNLLVSAVGSRERRAYLKFPLPQLPSYAVDVSSAVLRIFTFNDASAPYSAPINVFEAMGTWTESAIAWNNAPARSFGALDFNQTVSNDGSPHDFDISNLVWAWVTGAPNNGIVIVSLASNSTPLIALISREFGSPVSPTLTVTYVW